MFGAVLIALTSFLSGSWVGLLHPGDEAPKHVRDQLTRPDAPGAELMAFPGLARPDAPTTEWVPPPASSLRRPDSPQDALMRVDELRPPSEGYQGLDAPEVQRRLLDSLRAPESDHDSLALPAPELRDEPLLQRPSALRSSP